MPRKERLRWLRRAGDILSIIGLAVAAWGFWFCHAAAVGLAVALYVVSIVTLSVHLAVNRYARRRNR